MSLSRALVSLAFLSLALPLAGCTEPADSSSQDLADQASEDIDTLVALSEEVLTVALSADPVESGMEAWAGPGDCSFALDWSGNPLVGSVSVEADALPCGVSAAASGRGIEYRLDAFALTGGWTGTLAGDYTVDLSGSSDSTLITTTVRNGSVERDASFTLDSFEVVYADDVVEAVDLSLSYDGYLGASWMLTVSATPEAASGALTGPDGTTCAVSGSVAGVTIDCV